MTERPAENAAPDAGRTPIDVEELHRLVMQSLDDDQAQEVVQETVIAVARKIPDFRYDPAKGSFKQWLLLICRRRIQDHLRRIYNSRLAPQFSDCHDLTEHAASDDASQ